VAPASALRARANGLDVLRNKVAADAGSIPRAEFVDPLLLAKPRNTQG